jgi:hypothetical protein
MYEQAVRIRTQWEPRGWWELVTSVDVLFSRILYDTVTTRTGVHGTATVDFEHSRLSGKHTKIRLPPESLSDPVFAFVFPTSIGKCSKCAHGRSVKKLSRVVTTEIKIPKTKWNDSHD